LRTNTFTKPPVTEQELLLNAARLTGKSLLQIAGETGLQVPANQKRAKGWVGEIIEIYLGATASSLPEPDFQYLGIELKTLPLDLNGKPKETTFVCSVSLSGNNGSLWKDSPVRRKLARVLWVPVEASARIPLSQRRIGNPFIWSPSASLEAELRLDWQELMDLISMGEIARVDARQGKYLQIRPKAADGKALSRTSTENGEAGLTLPRGFYLRPAFTQKLLAEQQQSQLPGII
jgi:DNA mismatch repair protein MutH